MSYKHIIWDWNGTLLDDTWLCLEIMNDLLAARGRQTVSLETYRDWFQFPVQRYYELLDFDPAFDSFADVSHEFIAAYEKRRLESRVFDGAREWLERLRQAGIEQVVLSAYQHETLIELVGHFGLSSFFDQLIGLDNIYAEGKVHLAERHALSLRHAPHEMLLIGDTVHDAEVARQIGADCVLMTHGHNSQNRLEATGFPVIADHAALGSFLTVNA